MRDFSRALRELQVIARKCDWFIALFAPVVVGRSNCLGFGFYLQSFENRSTLHRVQSHSNSQNTRSGEGNPKLCQAREWWNFVLTPSVKLPFSKFLCMLCVMKEFG